MTLYAAAKNMKLPDDQKHDSEINTQVDSVHMGSDGGVKMQDSVTVNTKGPFEVRNHTAGPGKFFSGIMEMLMCQPRLNLVRGQAFLLVTLAS